MNKELINTDRPFVTSVDEARACFGERLSAFEGAQLKGVWALWDAKADGWYLDWAVVLETNQGHVSVEALCGFKLSIRFDEINLTMPVTFFEEGCDLYDLFDLSWRRYEELAFLEGRTLDEFFLRCDGNWRPYALDVTLGDTLLSIGSPWDETEPKVMEPGECWPGIEQDNIVPFFTSR